MAVHFVQSNLACFSDEISESDNDSVVVRTVKTLSATGSVEPELRHEKEARSPGGISSQ